MGVSAYILVQTEASKASAVTKKLRAIKGVSSADGVTGPYDVVVRADADSVDDLGRLVVSEVQLVDGVTRTLTCPMVRL